MVQHEQLLTQRRKKTKKSKKVEYKEVDFSLSLCSALRIPALFVPLRQNQHVCVP